MSNIIIISGIRGYVDKNGVAQLNAEDVARGWGFVEVKGEKKYVMWRRVNKYLQEFGFGTRAENPPLVGENDFIPENMVYRLGFKASNEAAQKFQALLADEVLPALRKTGTYTVHKENPSSIKQQEVEARLRNARVRESNQYLKIAAQINIPEYKYILQSKAAETLAGQPILPIQEAERKTYSAGDIGNMFGVSKQVIGKAANANGLKTPEYGKLFYSKSEYSVKEVETWRYYGTAVPVFAKLLGKEAVLTTTKADLIDLEDARQQREGAAQ